MKLLVLLMFVFLNLFAQNDYTMRLAYGKATYSTLGKALVGQWETSPVDSDVFALDGGYLLKEGAFDWPLDIYAKVGFSKFHDGSATQNSATGPIYYNAQDVYEGTVFIKAYWNFDFLQNRIRLSMAEGFSYTDKLLNMEKYEADEKDLEHSKFLNYLDFSLDFDFGRLIRYKPLEDTYVGWAIKHRSGIFGLINGVRGGSNYNCIYVEKKF